MGRRLNPSTIKGQDILSPTTKYSSKRKLYTAREPSPKLQGEHVQLDVQVWFRREPLANERFRKPQLSIRMARTNLARTKRQGESERRSLTESPEQKGVAVAADFATCPAPWPEQTSMRCRRPSAFPAVTPVSSISSALRAFLQDCR